MNGALVVLVGTIFGLQTLFWAAPAEAKFHKTLQEVTKNPGRAAECAKGDTKAVRKIVSGTIKHAKERFKIDTLVTAADKNRAQSEMYDFLKWKLGSPSAVCGQYITGGQKHFDKGYSDEAAAALLGLELPGDKRVEFKLPKKMSDQLKEQVKTQGEEVVAKKLQDDYGVPPELTEKVVKEISGAAFKQIDRIGFNMPKKWDVENKMVRDLIAARQAEKGK